MTIHGRAPAVLKTVLLAAAASAGLCAMALTAAAGDYSQVPTIRSGDPAAIALDPNDPVPEIGFRCHGRCGHDYDGDRHRGRDGYREHGPGHVFFVNCARLGNDTLSRWPDSDWDDAPEPYRHRHFERFRRVFNSVQDAVDAARPYDVIVIAPPGPGMTCVGQVRDEGKPLFITSAGPEQAVIEARPFVFGHLPAPRDPDRQQPGIERTANPGGPLPGAPFTETQGLHYPEAADVHSGEQFDTRAGSAYSCLVADLPLGDALIVRNVKFISRAGSGACVTVLAGSVQMQHVNIDSRTPDSGDRNDYGTWAFDVTQSGELALTDSKIETDTSGVLAERAHVLLNKVEIDVEEGRNGVGLALDRTDGTVSNVRIIGGSFGALVSAGPHGLDLEHIAIHKTYQALSVFDGEQGKVHLANSELTDNGRGVVVTPGSDVTMNALAIQSTRYAAVSIMGGRIELHDSRIRDAYLGITFGYGVGCALEGDIFKTSSPACDGKAYPRSFAKDQKSIFERVIRFLFGPRANRRPVYDAGNALFGEQALIANNEIVGVDYGFHFASDTLPNNEAVAAVRYNDGRLPETWDRWPQLHEIPVRALGNVIVARKECRDGHPSNLLWDSSNVCKD